MLKIYHLFGLIFFCKNQSYIQCTLKENSQNEQQLFSSFSYVCCFVLMLFLPFLLIKIQWISVGEFAFLLTHFLFSISSYLTIFYCVSLLLLYVSFSSALNCIHFCQKLQFTACFHKGFHSDCQLHVACI